MKILTYSIRNIEGRETFYVHVQSEMKNYWTYNKIINEYEESLGNRYAAVRAISAEARKRAEENENRISHSTALSWVILDEKPIQLIDPKYFPLTELEVLRKNTADYVLNIDDEEIRQAVTESIDESIESQYVVYNYGSVDDIERQSRVRILVNLIWDKVYLDRY